MREISVFVFNPDCKFEGNFTITLYIKKSFKRLTSNTILADDVKIAFKRKKIGTIFEGKKCLYSKWAKYKNGENDLDF